MSGKLKDKPCVVGTVTIIKNGEIVRKANLTLTDGKKWIAERITGTTNPATHIAVGAGTTAPALGDTTLQNELFRKALDVSGGTVTDNVATFRTVLREGEATGALTEAGLFLAATGGRMTNRTTFAVVNKGANDVVTIIWDIEIQ